jgi:hypothetical protein
MNPISKTPLGKEEDHQSNVGGAKKITCIRISFMEEIKRRLCTTSKKLQQYKTWEKYMQP